MSDKTKIKEMKLCLELTPEMRAQLARLASGQCNVLVFDCVDFEDLCIEEIKSDGLKIEEIKMKRGRIKCLKVKTYEPEC